MLLAVTCAAYAQMCPGVYEATQVNVTIFIPAYWTPYPSIKTVLVNLGLNATNTSTCYVYYDIHAYLQSGRNGMLPRVTVGPIECDFGLPQFISFGTINNGSCSLNGTSGFCCDNICYAGIVALPTGNYPYTYYANFGLLRSITIGQNSNGVYWNGLDQAITLYNVAWNEGTLSSNAVTVVSSTTGVTTGTASFSTTAATATSTAASLTITATLVGGDATATASAATVLATATGVASSVAATGSSLVSTTSSATTTAASSTTTAAQAVLTSAFTTAASTTVAATTSAASTTAAVTTTAATTTVAATTTAAAAATTTAAASTTSVAATTTAAAALLMPLKKK